ncbi:MAG: threonine aldolase family protein [Bradymonadia bacterium]
MIDLRSDTVTRPTPPMLEAMTSAEVGDDVLGEDPTVTALETNIAQRFGHEAGLFCPSGTMTNQIALQVHMRPGDEVICSALAHIYLYEGGGIAANAGASARLMQGERGMFSVDDARAAIRADDPHYPRTRLIALEDTCNRGGGITWPVDDISAMRQLADDHALALHLDGARVFNRLVARGEDARIYGQLYHSISICLSKGLGAPVGSVLVGNADFIAQARRVRKRLGGGMRQAGYLAAAGQYALDHHVDRLVEDHRRAARIAEALDGVSGVAHVWSPETNIVIGTLAEGVEPGQWLDQLKQAGVLAGRSGPGQIRMVTHLDVDDDDVAQVCRALQHM